MAHTWNRGRVGKVTQIDWSEWLDADRRIDPYLIWADVTSFVGSRERGGVLPGSLPLMIEFQEDQILVRGRAVGDEAHPVMGCITILGSYIYRTDNTQKKYPVGQTRTTTKYVTARAEPLAIEVLLKSKEIVGRFQLGLPRITSANPLPSPPAVQFDLRPASPRTIVGIIDDGCAFAHPRFMGQRFGRTWPSRVIALWDQDPAREAAGGTQGGWERAEYGALLGKTQLSNVPPANGNEFLPYSGPDYVPVDTGSPEAHGSSRHPIPVEAPVPNSTGSGPRAAEPTSTPVKFPASLPLQAMQRATHGTGVMDLAVGVDPPNSPSTLRRVSMRSMQPPRDYAPKWDVVFVQLPTRTILDTSGGSLGVHVLDAVRFIIRKAEDQPSQNSPSPLAFLSVAPATTESMTAAGAPSNRSDAVKAMFSSSTEREDKSNKWQTQGGGRYTLNRVVINISYGTTAGPHDGTSMLEGALNELLELRPYTSIVVAAGNAHKSKTHARLDLLRGESKSLSWQLAPDNPLESFLEVWIPALDSDGRALAPEVLREFVFRIRPPGFEAYRQVHIGGLWLLEDGRPRSESEPVAGAIFCRKVAQGLNGTMFLLAAAPTRAANHPDGNTTRAPAPHGEWIVEVSFAPGDVASGAAVQVHAWAERNDLQFGSKRRQQSTVMGEDRVPEPTEYMPDTLRLLRRHGALPGFGQRYLVGPDLSLGSLANGRSADLGRSPNSEGAPQLWVVGGYRLSDGEMASYSSGGPSLGRSPDRMGMRSPADSARSAATPDKLGEAGLIGAPLSDWRMGPDFDAPSDISVASRGLPVAGTRPGISARLSGTSAAAPILTRWLANMWYACNRDNQVSDAEIRELIDKNLAGEGAGAMPDAARPTSTPLMDDLYRKGKWRLRWWPR